MNLKQQAHEFLLKGDCHQVAKLYEDAIQAEPDNISHYWHLGLSYLLQEHEEEAQMTWFLAMEQGTPEDVDQWTVELIQVLEIEAQRQESLENYQLSWLIRQHIREIVPTEISNLLHLIQLSIQIETFVAQSLAEWGVIELLEKSLPGTVNPSLLFQVLDQLLKFPQTGLEVVAFAKVCLQQVEPCEALIDGLVQPAFRLAFIANKPALASRLLELCLEFSPAHLGVLETLSYTYTAGGSPQASIEAAKHFYTHCQTLPLKVTANFLILRGLMMSGGRRQEVGLIQVRHQSLLMELIQAQPKDLDFNLATNLIASPGLFAHLRDDPTKNRWLQNQTAQLCQSNLQANAGQQIQHYYYSHISRSNSSRPLRVGYLSHCLRQHSVGWLSRWLFQHHNRESFHLSIYFYNQPISGFTHTWFVNQVDAAHNLEQTEPQTVANKIFEDQIDILVDLDSITLPQICSIMALKPAPVQVSWLGWDASGLPAVDYFIADPYVLPENAQEYYQETIWRLPQTYVAVDGFEVEVPTLRRDQLGIPADAIVYLSAQSGPKRHPDTARLQMQILKQVPNSYFLIKGPADEVAVQEAFTQLAETAGVDPGRLRFLPKVPSEPVHRANLGIADVVLDTYPYNGTTTTLETLWMGIPLVTRVGLQIAARNSYAFLTNVGVTEGIAWTDEEYVEWGVRLGKDEALRQQVAWKLKASRQTSPLWNAQKFTREMEKAYQQMWARYIEAGK